MNLAEITAGKAWKNFMAKLYGIGAAVVIMGALFKIQHYPGAGIMLNIGLGTEAIIFFFSAFEPLHEDVDWSLVYPELSSIHGAEDETGDELTKGTITEQLDNMLEEAKIGPELLESVGSGLRALGDTTSKLSDLSNASVATEDYIKNVKGASESVGDLSKSYGKAAEIMGQINNSAESVKSTQEQMQTAASQYSRQVEGAAKNVEALNSVYEMQLKESNDQLKSASKLYDGINQLMANLNGSIEDTQRYKDEVAKLAKNLGALNTVYGNMLSAMNINKA